MLLFILFQKETARTNISFSPLTNLTFCHCSSKYNLFFFDIKENNRTGKTNNLFKKIRDTKGTFHVKMGMIKDRNGKDLTKAEEIKKR